MSHARIPPDAIFQFTSPSALVHTITHNLNDNFPDVVVINNATNQIISPTITVINANQITITLFTALSIRGQVEG